MDSVLAEARERFRHSEAASSRVRRHALEDWEFGRLGMQWPEAIRQKRERDGRPCLTVNRLPSFIRRVVNDARQNKPSISVHPVEGGDVDTARVIGGLIRSIERGSNAALAYDHAIDCAASGGFGFFRITTDYVHPESFEQDARIERVANPFSVHWDTASTAFDASDWEFAFVSEMLTQAAFKQRYPKADAVSWQESDGEGHEDWGGADMIRVAEYWQRVEKKRRIALLSDGTVQRMDVLDDLIIPGMRRLDLLMLQGVEIVRERDATFHEVKRRIITSADVLSEEDWPGSMIPIVPVWGEEVILRGERHFRSLIRDARDPASMLNFWRTAASELVALAPKAPYLVPMGGIPPEEEGSWRRANTDTLPYLIYDPSAGPMPSRQPFAGVPAGALQEAMIASDDMKAVMGIFDASLGARSNETSGRAIMARQRESDIGTFHFVDNLSRAIQYAARVLIEIIPALYSERQAVSILGEDAAETVVRVARMHGVPPSTQAPDGRIYDLSTGKYDVTVKIGPSYATQREQTVNALMEMGRVAPETVPVLGDMMVKNMDWPGADEAAKRLQLMQIIQLLSAVPPAVVAQLPPDTPGLPQLARKLAQMIASQQQPGAVMPPGMAAEGMLPAST